MITFDQKFFGFIGIQRAAIGLNKRSKNITKETVKITKETVFNYI